ncbi:hypothetical protein ABZ934_22960 [Streptomyces sp. NPDC046557]|uniref:hypothetical protein n=1 Tax=Streptomyces sp. NPDC046557 TaxID=3155372 RepID=UPI0033F73A18
MSSRLVAAATLIAAASVLGASADTAAADRDTACVQTTHQDIARVKTVEDNGDVVAAVRSARPVVAAHPQPVRGGACHHDEEAPSGGAGGGRRLAARAGGLNAIGAVGLAGGILVTAGVTLWLARRRPTGFR